MTIDNQEPPILSPIVCPRDDVLRQPFVTDIVADFSTVDVCNKFPSLLLLKNRLACKNDNWGSQLPSARIHSMIDIHVRFWQLLTKVQRRFFGPGVSETPKYFQFQRTPSMMPVSSIDVVPKRRKGVVRLRPRRAPGPWRV